MMNTNSPDDLLQFRDFSNAPGTSSPPQINVNSPSHSITFPELIDMPGTTQSSNNNNNMNLNGPNDGNTDGNNAGNSGKVSFLTIEYYRQFFNVDTFMVLDRIGNSMIPKRAPVDYLRTTIEKNPDLYGPFWIAITLIFSAAITGNIYAYIVWARDDVKFHYKFRLVSYAATAVFIYANIVPLGLWATFKATLKPIPEGQETENADYTPSLLALWCLYGYSLAIYIPVSILWVIPVGLVKTILIIVAGGVSGVVLISALRPALRNSRIAFWLLIVIVACNFILAAVFWLLFYYLPTDTSQPLEQQRMDTLKGALEALHIAVNSTASNASKI